MHCTVCCTYTWSCACTALCAVHTHGAVHALHCVLYTTHGAVHALHCVLSRVHKPEFATRDGSCGSVIRALRHF